MPLFLSKEQFILQIVLIWRIASTPENLTRPQPSLTVPEPPDEGLSPTTEGPSSRDLLSGRAGPLLPKKDFRKKIHTAHLLPAEARANEPNSHYLRLNWRFRFAYQVANDWGVIYVYLINRKNDPAELSLGILLDIVAGHGFSPEEQRQGFFS